MRRFVTIDGLRVLKRSRLFRWLQATKAARHGWLKHKPKPPAPTPAPTPAPKPVKVYMYDDINLNLIPRTARYVGAYVDGRWQTILKIRLRCPLATVMSIAVFATDDADCLDVERLDATNAQAPAWVRRQIARRKAGAKHTTRLPVLYTSASNGNALNDMCAKAGLRIGVDYDWLSAHYDPRQGEHMCNPKCYPGLRYTAAATQFTDHADNVNLDESVCSPGFFI